MSVIVSTLGEVELGVELWWNYMKFHPNSTPNSTLDKPLIIREVTIRRWKGGITNEKIYFSEIRVGKVLTTVKNNTKQVSLFFYFTYHHKHPDLQDTNVTP